MNATIILLLACLALADPPTPITVAVPERVAPVSYAREVSGLLAAKCVGCHNEGLAGGKLSLENLAGMLKGGKRGPSLIKGKADESLLFRLAAHRAEPVMPPADKKEAAPLTPGELGLLKLWIDAGAPDDSAEAPAAPIELGELPASVRPILALDLNREGKLVALGRGNRVHVVEIATGRELATLGGHRDLIQSVRLSPDGKRLAAGSYEYATLWDVPGDPSDPWPAPRRFGPHAFRVLAIDFSPDGRWMATGGGDPSRSGEVKVWDLATGILVRSLDKLHSDTVFSVRYSPDGSKLATASADRFLKVIRSDDGKELKAFEGHTHHVLAVDWSLDGKQLVTGGADGLVKVWDFELGEQLRTLTPAVKPVTAVRWQPGKPRVAGASGDSKVRFWSTEGEGNIERTFEGASDYLFTLATTADGKLLAAGGSDGVLFLWNGEDGRLLRKWEPPSPGSTVK